VFLILAEPDCSLIDGEAVVLPKDGRSDFYGLMTKRGGAQAMPVAFDLPRLNGGDQRLRPARRQKGLSPSKGVSARAASDGVFHLNNVLLSLLYSMRIEQETVYDK
jgi:hypothetical protein